MFLQEGFRYHHAEPEYLMLVSWISNTPDTIPANASHIVGVGALVLNKNTREVIKPSLNLKGAEEKMKNVSHTRRIVFLNDVRL